MIETNTNDEFFEITVPNEWTGKTIQQIFKEVIRAPKKLTHQFRMEKMVLLNDQVANWTAPLEERSNLLQLRLFNDQPFPIIPVDHSIHILYEDEHLLIVNKPSGVETHPNEEGQTNTIANGVAYYLQEKSEFRHVRHVHRLDKDTSGAIIFSKHALAGALLDQMIEQQKVTRVYVALVHGKLRKKTGMINEPIGRDRHHPTKRRVSPSGQTASTTYRVIETYHKKNMSVVQCELLTGRTHQIRVHLSYIGHPLVGDTLYGGKKVFPRQALHAIKLQFIHPLTWKQMNCVAPFLDEPAIFPSEIFKHFSF